MLRRLTLLATVVAALFLSGCEGDSNNPGKLNKKAEDMVYKLYNKMVYKLEE